MAAQPTGTVTLLFTDIQGSTEMLRALGRSAYIDALGQHRRILREAAATHGGVEIEMQGDSFFFAFSSARSGILAAGEAQRALAAASWESLPVRVRMGLHTGEPDVTDEGLYAGLDVHRAARIMSIGHGGQVILSARTTDLVEGDLPSGVQLRPLGSFLLKDFDRPEALSQLEASGLPNDFPPLRATVARRRRLDWRAVAGVAVLATAAVAAASLSLRGGEGGPRQNVVAEIDPGGNLVVRRVAVGTSPTAIAAGSGGVWAVNAADATLSEVSPRGKFVRTFGTDGTPTAVAAAGGVVWVADQPQTIVRIDPTTSELGKIFTLHAPLSRVAPPLIWMTAQGSIVWATVQAHLIRVDAATGKVRVLSLPGPDWGAVAVQGKTIWESQYGELYQLSETGRTIASLRFAQGALAAAGGYLWAVNRAAGVVAQIDPRARSVVRTVPVGDGPTGMAYGDGSLWVCSEDGTVTRINPATARAVATIKVGGSPQAVAYGFGRAWVAVS